MPSGRASRCLLLATLAGLVVPCAAALADPPARVARISFLSGAVSFRPASLDEWSVATLNYPVTTGDDVWTDRDARSELQLGSAVVRLAASTAFSVLNLDDDTAQLRMTQGALSVRVRTLRESEVLEIDLPNGAVSLLRPGLYRIDVNDAGDSSTVTVRQGDAEVSAGDMVVPVHERQSVVLTGFDPLQSDVRAPVGVDDFENWSAMRDRQIEHVQTAQYVSPDTIGYEDLDANGSWEVAQEYGPVWIPRVGAEWAPYRFGHWAWVDPWGWTWIDAAAWGFAPFHYGRWAFLPARGWAWVPGTAGARPVYAPALVAFVGGANWRPSARLGPGPVAWFPLGPREAFVPAYRVAPVYVQRVNAPHVANVNPASIAIANGTYVNRAVPGAVTAVPRDVFVQAGSVASAVVVVPREQLGTAVVVTVPPVAPQRISLAGPAQTPARVPPQGAAARQVVVRRAPPPPAAPFAARQGALEQHPGEPLDEQAEAALRLRTSPAAARHPLVRVVAAPTAAAGNRPATPFRQAPAPVPAAPVQQAPPPASRPPSVPDLAARHAQERAELNARHGQERAALQARHQQEEQHAANPAQRAQLRQQHQQEMQGLRDRQTQERAAVQKRQEDERKK